MRALAASRISAAPQVCVTSPSLQVKAAACNLFQSNPSPGFPAMDGGYPQFATSNNGLPHWQVRSALLQRLVFTMFDPVSEATPFGAVQ